MKLLIVGNPAPTHMAAHLIRAAADLGLVAHAIDVESAWARSRWVNRGARVLLDKRPPLIGRFNRTVMEEARRQRPSLVVVTGIAPLTAATVRGLRSDGAVVCNYLTDDPFSRDHRSKWFVDALAACTHIFTPRRSVVHDLAEAGCTSVHYVPFGYCPHSHFQERVPPAELARYTADVFFAGAGDRDRIPYMSALIAANLKLALFGPYWQRFQATRNIASDYADLETMRRCASAASVSLCLVRRANRDGQVMRTYEVPAMGGCMLMEDTSEHRELFGTDGECVVYFRNENEMVTRALELMGKPELRTRLRRAAQERVTRGRHTYADRLRTMLSAGGFAADASVASGSALSESGIL